MAEKREREEEAEAASAAGAACDEGAPPKRARRSDGGGFDPAVSLEDVRVMMHEFAEERDWAQFHTPRNVLLALTGEVGELAELFQWRGDGGARPGLPSWSDADRTHLGEELSDVLLYLVRLSDRCGVDLADAVRRKMVKNAEKYPAERARGSSAKYDQLQ